MTVQNDRAISISMPTITMPTTTAPAATPDILPGCRELLVSGDAGAMIAALSVEMGRSQKKAASAARHNAEATEDAEQGAQIQALREKADLVRIQGVVDGALTLAEGACAFGSSMKTAEGKSKAAAAYKGGADFLGAGKQLADGLFKGAIADKDTDAQVHEQLATRAKRAVDEATGDYEDAKKLLEKALDFYKEYTGAKNGAVSAAIHRA